MSPSKATAACPACLKAAVPLALSSATTHGHTTHVEAAPARRRVNAMPQKPLAWLQQTFQYRPGLDCN
eukprot:CAMPEP_0204604592 /NCGR_PEP_ID=MMETSP0661-20131031/57967_1 /ASSEMBLY_ACC=CAM_ASM_000606 /TAXON_ID=109239 /ORGANISM="Alexandrium margalefi, Strain AMGDE01CS-322" /LENGTH=67 /DNA_ID=CAMNT_0051615767 /DNA_START=462 /DNA_END=662 /DNA_ORIENTATION=-